MNINIKKIVNILYNVIIKCMFDYFGYRDNGYVLIGKKNMFVLLIID